MDLARTIALETDDGLMPEEDLIGEAYLGLAEALRNLGDDADEDALDDAIRAHLRKVREEMTAMAENDGVLVDQVRELSECIENLTKELGTKPNPDEIANDMGISQEEVLSILKLAGEDIDRNS